MQQRYILAGHSHAMALGAKFGPADAVSSLDRLPGFSADVLALSGPFPPQEPHWDLLVQSAANSTVFLLWQGNQHLARFLFATGPPFDFFIATQPDRAVHPDAVIVPESAVRDVMRAGFDGLSPLLDRLNAVAGCNPVVVGTPPPKGDDDKLRRLLVEPHFMREAERQGLSVETAPLISATIRLKLWLVMQEVLYEIANRHGRPFVPVPEEAFDEQGFLKEEFWLPDVTHANLRYGDLMWKHLTGPGNAS